MRKNFRISDFIEAGSPRKSMSYLYHRNGLTVAASRRLCASIPDDYRTELEDRTT